MNHAPCCHSGHQARSSIASASRSGGASAQQYDRWCIRLRLDEGQPQFVVRTLKGSGPGLDIVKPAKTACIRVVQKRLFQSLLLVWACFTECQNLDVWSWRPAISCGGKNKKPFLMKGVSWWRRPRPLQAETRGALLGPSFTCCRLRKSLGAGSARTRSAALRWSVGSRRWPAGRAGASRPWARL